jgi:hypothetical protein
LHVKYYSINSKTWCLHYSCVLTSSVCLLHRNAACWQINLQLLGMYKTHMCCSTGTIRDGQVHLRGVACDRIICTENANEETVNIKTSLQFQFFFRLLCGLSMFKIIYSVLNTYRFLKSSKSPHVSA